MKKIIAASLLGVFVLGATSVFAADVDTVAIVWANKGLKVVTGTAAVATTRDIGKLSTGVALAYKCATTGYALITQHENGVKAFGTAHDSTAITWKTVAKGATTGAPATADSGSISGATWTIM